MHTEVLERSYLRSSPSLLFIPVDGQHVVREDLPEGQLVDWGLGSHLGQAGLTDL